VVLTFTPFGNYQGSATLACSGLPAFATCTFTPPAIAFNGDNSVQTDTLLISTTAGHAVIGANSSAVFWVPGVLLAFLIATRRRKLPTAARGLLMLAVLACTAFGLNACGTAPDNITPIGSSSAQINVTATATAGSGSTNINQSINIGITITQ